jgi:hypothetical protein
MRVCYRILDIYQVLSYHNANPYIEKEELPVCRTISQNLLLLLMLPGNVLLDTFDSIVFIALHTIKALGDSRLWGNVKHPSLHYQLPSISLSKELDANYLLFFSRKFFMKEYRKVNRI